MGCGGGYHGLFRMVENMGHYDYGNSCGSNRPRHSRNHRQDDWEEQHLLIKKMFAEDLITDDEYLTYKEQIDAGIMNFDELVRLRGNRLNGKSERKKTIDLKKMVSDTQKNDYKDKINQLSESKSKILEIQEKIHSNITDLKKEKKSMEDLAETIFKSDEEAAEKYIRNKLDIEEKIQSLTRKNKELSAEMNNINRYIKHLEVKELEQEANHIREELSTLHMDKDSFYNMND